MLLNEEREKLVEYGVRLIESNLTKGTAGNLSIFNRKEELIAITPSGVAYDKIKLQDIVIIDSDGRVHLSISFIEYFMKIEMILVQWFIPIVDLLLLWLVSTGIFHQCII